MQPSISASFARIASHASNTADPVDGAPQLPPDPEPGGNAESPSRASTSSGFSPSISAVIWPSTVYVPVPMSVMSLSTIAVPSGHSRTRASASLRLCTRAAVAMPVPIHHSPSRRLQGARSAPFHPNRSAPWVKHSASLRELYGMPWLGWRSGILRSRSSTGSRPIASASSSIAHSSASMPTASPGARTEPAVIRFTRATSRRIVRCSPR